MLRHLVKLQRIPKLKPIRLPVRRMAYETRNQFPMIIEPFGFEYKPLLISFGVCCLLYYLIFCGSGVDLFDTQPAKDNYSREFARFMKQVEEDDPELAALIKQKVGESTYDAYRKSNKTSDSNVHTVKSSTSSSST